MGLTIDAVVCPMRPKKVSPSRTHSVIVSKTRRINNMEAPLRCLIDSLYSSTFWGRNSWESFLVNETFDTKQSLPCQKATLEVPIKKALASRVSSPSPPSTPTTSRSRPCWWVDLWWSTTPIGSSFYALLVRDSGRLLWPVHQVICIVL